MDLPTDCPFVYNRNHPPLFFAAPTREEFVSWKQSMAATSREYFRHVRSSNGVLLDHRLTLSNGMTMGEFAMWTCVKKNAKRKANTA